MTVLEIRPRVPVLRPLSCICSVGTSEAVAILPLLQVSRSRRTDLSRRRLRGTLIGWTRRLDATVLARITLVGNDFSCIKYLQRLVSLAARNITVGIAACAYFLSVRAGSARPWPGSPPAARSP